MKVETIRETNHGDWKTRLAHNIPPIPKGTRLDVIETWYNFHGKWVSVMYNGRIYDISPKDLKRVESEVEG